MKARTLAAAAVVAALAGVPALAQKSVHGANSIFVEPTVKLAWAIKRGTSEDTTLVTIRFVNTTSEYRAIGIVGVNPFSKNQKVVVPTQAFGKEVDLAIPRSSFVEFPGSEIHLFKAEPAKAGQPDLIVYYLGVPDTAPEFAAVPAMDAYLAKMLAEAR